MDLELRSIISEHDLEFLASLGDSDLGYVIRGDVAEMYGVPVEEIDNLIINMVRSENIE